MSKTRRLFISDMHLGDEGDKHRPNLLAFLRWAGQQDDVKDLVLLGDVFDTWTFPMATTPPDFRTIARDHGDIVDAIRSCARGVQNVFYVTGNHDALLTQDDLDAIFGTGVVRWITRYNAGLLYAEHGNRFSMLNAPDKLHDPADGYPLGYFMTRLAATSDRGYKRPAAIARCLDDMLEAAFTTQTLAESLIEALMEHAGKAPDDAFEMPGGRRRVTIRDVQRRYAPLFQRWVEKFGHQYALRAIRCEQSLGWFADRLSIKYGYRVVVLGHTHRDVLDRDAILVSNSRIYANAGGGPGDTPTFVDVDKQPGRFVVRLYQCMNGDITRKGEASVGS
jgi:UDP-2,3-diacylglucosamine pyrophosphatase LpxH